MRRVFQFGSECIRLAAVSPEPHRYPEAVPVVVGVEKDTHGFHLNGLTPTETALIQGTAKK